MSGSRTPARDGGRRGLERPSGNARDTAEEGIYSGEGFEGTAAQPDDVSTFDGHDDFAAAEAFPVDDQDMVTTAVHSLDRESFARMRAMYYACEADGRFADADDSMPLILFAGYAAMAGAACAFVRFGTGAWVAKLLPWAAPRLRMIRVAGYAVSLATTLPFGDEFARAQIASAVTMETTTGKVWRWRGVAQRHAGGVRP